MVLVRGWEDSPDYAVDIPTDGLNTVRDAVERACQILQLSTPHLPAAYASRRGQAGDGPVLCESIPLQSLSADTVVVIGKPAEHWVCGALVTGRFRDVCERMGFGQFAEIWEHTSALPHLSTMDPGEAREKMIQAGCLEEGTLDMPGV
mmetsp:Transcript_99371/g.265721  ORF Transcript_99371/g.265721 Transcript_99371/m.265721 type:complete len:148 (+) Transcript_99371:69-512(+)